MFERALVYLITKYSLYRRFSRSNGRFVYIMDPEFLYVIKTAASIANNLQPLMSGDDHRAATAGSSIPAATEGAVVPNRGSNRGKT
jgi:hypothetical protein